MGTLSSLFFLVSFILYYSSLLLETKAVKLPVEYLVGQYIVQVSLGTPAQNLSLIIDTGSDLSWAWCNGPATEAGLAFNPKASRSYLPIPCHEPSVCSVVFPNHTCPDLNGNQTCKFTSQYNDGSKATGFLVMEQLTIPQSGDSFQEFIFSCVDKTIGPTNLNGRLGLGRDLESFVTQTEQTYRGFFSYCFPRASSSNGFLALGRGESSPGDISHTKFTPLVDNSTYYVIEMVSISVGGVQLQIMDPSILSGSRSGAIVDSGTVITRLASGIYGPLRDEFDNQMRSVCPSAPPLDGLLDTCYNMSQQESITVPIVSFTFRGDVKVDLDADATLLRYTSETSCFAFVENADEFSVFGVTQQKTFEVVYDVDGGKLGFRSNAC